MFRVTEERLKKLKELEGWNDSDLEELKKTWIEDPIYVWGGKDEEEAKAYLKAEEYIWSEGDKNIDSFDPGWTWGYPVVLFLEKGKRVSYTPVEFGRETDEEPSLD